MNRDLGGLDELQAAGKVAWILGIGYEQPEPLPLRVHRPLGPGSAVPNGTAGWGASPTAPSTPGHVLRGLTVTSDLPIMLRGASRASSPSPARPATSIPPTCGRTGWEPLRPEPARVRFAAAATSVAALASSQPGYAAGARPPSSSWTRRTGSAWTRPRRPHPDGSLSGDASYPVTRVERSRLSGSLSTQLKLVAQMIAAELPVEIFFCRIGGWDTHSNQATDHANLMRTLGGAIHASTRTWRRPDRAGNAQDG